MSSTTRKSAFAEGLVAGLPFLLIGVPFAVRGASKYWGHDRFELLVEEAAA